MFAFFDQLRQLNLASILLRLTLAMLFGGLIGLERERKRRPAGFRTYMLVCLGAALTMLLSQYEYYMITNDWAALAGEIGIRTDVSRFGAQVINGIGFLGAGTIIVTGRQEVKGLTTAAGLWASACMGLAIGAGFYECVLLGFLLIFLAIRLLPYVENSIIENARNMNIYVEFQSLDDVGAIINRINEHTARMTANRDKLNALDLESIHMTSANGTDLVVGLADTHSWEGAASVAGNGIPFIPNIPTEEVFTAPHRLHVDGVVKGTKPYVYNGQLIKGFSVTFKDGKVVAHSAEKNDELLGELLASDEGASHIGEIALVPASSPINRSGVLFYNTLFDENAACHIAFGAGYPGTVKGGNTMSKEELLALGVNDSAIHEDVMVGAEDMTITGLCKDGRTVTIFENGEWAL